MRNSKNNAKCEKRHYEKCVNNPAKMYSVLQRRYADILEADDQVKTFEINVPVEIDVEKGVYTTDFLIELTDGTKTVKECVFRKHLCQPKTVNLLSQSKRFWEAKGIEKWGLVLDAANNV